MGILIAVALAAAIAAGWLLRRKQQPTAPTPEKALPFPPWEPLGVPDVVSPATEKVVPGHDGFLTDLKRREREVVAKQPRRRDDVGRDNVIDAEFHEVTDRDRLA